MDARWSNLKWHPEKQLDTKNEQIQAHCSTYKFHYRDKIKMYKTHNKWDTFTFGFAFVQQAGGASFPFVILIIPPPLNYDFFPSVCATFQVSFNIFLDVKSVIDPAG